MITLQGLLTSILSAVAAYLFYKHVQSTRMRNFSKNIGGPQGIFLFGNAFDLNLPIEGVVQRFIQWMDEYGPRFCASFGWLYFFFTRNLSDVEKILSSTVQVNKSSDYEFLRPWLGDGLLTSTGAKWAARRKLLTPAFHFKILEQFMGVFNKQTMRFCDILRPLSESQETFDVCPFITRCTLDIICETAMGKPIDAQTNVDHEYMLATHTLNALFQYRSVRFWLQPDFIWNLFPAGKLEKKNLDILHGFTSKVIQERKTDLRLRKLQTKEDNTEEDVFLGKKKRPMAFMDLLLEHQFNNPCDISDQEIREETDTIMFAGHDTTAASASWTLYLLGIYPKEQDKIIEELDAVFGNDKSRDVTPEDLTRLKYLECCIKEALRIYPSVPFIGRTLSEDLRLDDNTVVIKGMDASIFPISVHHDPQNFPDPQSFKPERFFLENSLGRHPYAYIPFSAGPRNCIGQKFALMEEKVLLANFFRNFRCKSVDPRDTLILTAAIITRSKTGIRIKISPRIASS